MGLRTFHLFFISISVVLAAFVVAWATGQYRLEHEGIYIVWMVAGACAGVALAVYGTQFQKKTRNL
jgi:ABC-type Fe3+-siderophore transport system permease subunit